MLTWRLGRSCAAAERGGGGLLPSVLLVSVPLVSVLRVSVLRVSVPLVLALLALRPSVRAADAECRRVSRTGGTAAGVGDLWRSVHGTRGDAGQHWSSAFSVRATSGAGMCTSGHLGVRPCCLELVNSTGLRETETETEAWSNQFCISAWRAVDRAEIL